MRNYISGDPASLGISRYDDIMARKGRRSSNEERLNAIRLLEQGYTKSEVANILDVAESSVYEWQKKFREGGLAALSTKIASGRKSLLADEQLLKLYKWLRGNPRQVQFDFGLWTRKIVRELIKREFGIDYTPQNVGKILKMLGFSPQRPVYQALERDPEKRRIWMEETFPSIKDRAEQEGAKIYFADEAACRTDNHGGRSWARVGRTPVVQHMAARETIGMISAISMRGDIHWMIYTESMDSSLFTAYLNYLIQDIDGKIFLITDRARYHTSAETSSWIAEHKERIELFFLPSYSPDMNPDEWVWKNVKHDHIYRVVPQEPGQLFTTASKALHSLREAPEKVRGFFSDPNLAYIRRAYA
jgi:transposase